MKPSFFPHLILVVLMTITSVHATEVDFLDLAVTCKPVTIEDKGYSYELELKIIASDISKSGEQEAVLVMDGGNNTSIHLGVLNPQGISGTFISASKLYKIDLNIKSKSKESELHIQYSDGKEWNDLYKGSIDCSFILYGSEGAHN